MKTPAACGSPLLLGRMEKEYEVPDAPVNDHVFWLNKLEAPLAKPMFVRPLPAF